MVYSFSGVIISAPSGFRLSPEWIGKVEMALTNSRINLEVIFVSHTIVITLDDGKSYA
jgi:hypothetical protein